MNSRSAPRLDRFVAFSFCWAEIVIELDARHRITFMESLSGDILGGSAATFTGKPVHDLVCDDDQPLLRNVLKAVHDHGRIEDIDIRFRDAAGAPVPLSLAAHYLGDGYDRYYLALHCRHAWEASDPATAAGRSGEGLHEGDAFAEVARACFSAARSAAGSGKEGAGDPKLSLLSVPGLKDADERLSEAQRRTLQSTVASVLRGYSANGDAAARFADDRYGLVHEASVDLEHIKQRLGTVLLTLDPSGGGGVIESATLSAGPEVSEEDVAKGLVYAINEFQKTSRTSLTITDLGDNLGRLVRKGVGSLVGFRHIIRGSQFDIAFHPIIGVTDGGIHHYEVLARFHGRHGDSPYQYITFAEETGLIVEFDLAMTEKVIDWMAQCGHAGVRLAVNLSGKSITDARFGDQLLDLLDRHRWTRRRLMFEITESFQIDDLGAANQLIQQLRRAGHAISLDDFGAGAASFKYLNMLDVDIVKFDESAIRNSQAVAKGPAFLRALTTLCHEVGVHCVAEMIDSDAALRFVRDCGVDFVQGFLFGKPSGDLTAFAFPGPGAAA